MLIIAIIAALLIFACGVATFIMLGSFALNWADTISSMPDFINSGNFFGWVSVLIAFSIASYIIRIVYGLVIQLIAVILSAVGMVADKHANKTQNDRAVVAMFIVGALTFVLTIVGLMVGVHYIFELAAEYPDYATMYNPDPEKNGLAKFLHFMFFAGAIFNSGSDKD